MVGLLGRVAAIPDGTFESLGRARLLGKHMVLRDLASDAHARVDRSGLRGADAQEAFLRLDRHATIAVFLHEWAHTLGVVHSLDSDSLMAPLYSTRAVDFDDDSRRLLAAAIPRLLPFPVDTLRWRLAAEDMLDVLGGAPSSAFLVDERRELVAALERLR